MAGRKQAEGLLASYSNQISVKKEIDKRVKHTER